MSKLYTIKNISCIAYWSHSIWQTFECYGDPYIYSQCPAFKKEGGEGRGKMLCQSDGQISNSIMGVYGKDVTEPAKIRHIPGVWYTLWNLRN